MTQQVSKLPLFPLTAGVNERDHLTIGGCDTVELAAEFGTPLYVFDETSLRDRCAEFIREFGERYPATKVNYSCKAFINGVVLRIFAEEGLGLDVVSGGEIGIAQSADFPMEKIDFPGNNKSAEELTLALDAGIGHVVVDNFHELKMLGGMVREKDCKPDVLLRISPGVDPHTHRYLITGNTDSKFGIPMARAEEALRTALDMPEINVTGLHFHIGSQIADFEPYLKSIDYMLGFAADMKKKCDFECRELSIGGGFAVQYTLDSPVPSISAYAEAMTSGIIENCDRLGLEKPRLIIEPGRSVVAQAGVALYTVGVIKDIPGVRCYASVDGGMADNIRPALYQAVLEAVVADRMADGEGGTYTISGKYCEPGDVLIHDISLPALVPGDTLAVPGCGAYSIPEATNYNASFKPAIVMVKDGASRLIRRRETVEDLIRCDVL